MLESIMDLPFGNPMQSAGPPAQPMRGPNFSYLLPQGWSVGEEGPYALVMRSPDLRAGIVVFGQSGMMHAMSPEQFAHQSMAGTMRLAPDVQLSPGQPLQPMPGYTHAAVMQTTYTVHGPMGPVRIVGTVVSNVAVGYGQCNGVITLASSDVNQWEHYRHWLPQVALAAQNTGPDAYGSRSMSQTISGIANQDHQAYQQYRAWSDATWQAVSNDRAASQDRQQGAMGPLLTGQEWINDPYGNQPRRWSTTPAAIWVSRDGQEVTSDDPSFDPRTPMNSDWRRVR